MAKSTHVAKKKFIQILTLKRQGRVALPQILAYEIKGCFQIGVARAISW
jgi:hypothetical protein